MRVQQASAAQVGIMCAIAAYTMWGIAPIYFKQLTVLPAAEILMHRIIWSVLVLVGLIVALNQWTKVMAAFRNKKVMQVLLVAGIYVQNLHQDKLFDVNIGKMASYAVKSATRYKHSFIGSDVGDELMLQSELAGLIDLYDQIQKRNWRALMFAHTVGSGQMTILSNKEADSTD